MQIIIVGCGKVGSTLAEQLSREDNDITVLDTNGDRVEQLVNEFDIMGYIGSGISFEMLVEAGVKKADLLIAVTGSDELNLMCCLIAKKAGNCQTIARVRNPEYTSEVDFLKKELGLAMVINPELAAATEASRVLRLPALIGVEVFAKGKAEILKVRIKAGSPLCDMQVQDIYTKLRSDILVCVVERGEEITIPNGMFTLREKDNIYIVGATKSTIEFFKKVGIEGNPARSIMMVGGGKVSYYLAKLLSATGMDVKILEKDAACCDMLSQKLPNVTIIHGDGTDKALLMEEGLDQVDAFAALTGMDEENVFLSLYAKRQADVKTLTKINRIAFDEVISSLDLDTVVYPKEITAEFIIRYARALGNSIGSNVESLHRIAGGKVEALEFIIRENSPVVNIPLMNLNLKDDILVACIQRHGKIILPRGNDAMQVDDTVVVVTTRSGLRDIRDILGKSRG
ncbi:MAG: Trk system potassium transporter TrkA [Eubacteriales bacterium]|nr:Trk system potassium transporter TrkA [Eubacteriales bacterium]